jgi:hypothetical protein
MARAEKALENKAFCPGDKRPHLSRLIRAAWLTLAAVARTAALCRNVHLAVRGREASPGGGELGWGELVTIDPGAGQVETALAVGVREVRDAVVAHTVGEGEQVLELMGASGRVRAAGDLRQSGATGRRGLINHRPGVGGKGLLVEDHLPRQRARGGEDRARHVGETVLAEAPRREKHRIGTGGSDGCARRPGHAGHWG